MINIFIIISLLYFFLIIWLIIGFKKIKIFDAVNSKNKTTFSVLIPFRNEENNLIELINSLNKIDYPKNQFEIIFINDDSDDNSVDIIRNSIDKKIIFNIINNTRVSNSPKKDALTKGITTAKHTWILTTDADCTVPQLWLKILSAFIEKEKKCLFIALPVNYTIKNRFLENFQKIDFLSLIGSTIGSFGNNNPLMCNGANLCYKKEVFIKLKGFEGNNNIASGDDIFLMEKIRNYNKASVQFLKNQKVTVYTKPVNTLKNLIEQRIRWASKTGNTKNKIVIVFGSIVFLFNLLLIIMFFYGFLKPQPVLLKMVLLVFILKLILDYILIQKTFHFFDEKLNLKNYLLTGILHPFFITGIPLLSIFKKYRWKERIYYK